MFRMIERARGAKEQELYTIPATASGSRASAHDSQSSRAVGGSTYAYEDDGSDGASIIRPSVDRYAQYTGLKGVYYNPVVQVYFLGFVCFMGPGLFNALTGLGGGGQLDSTTNSNANSALYATFAVAAFFAGSVLLSLSRARGH